MDDSFNESLWTTVLKSHCGRQCERVAVDDNVKESLWTMILKCHCGRQC